MHLDSYSEIWFDNNIRLTKKSELSEPMSGFATTQEKAIVATRALTIPVVEA
jgi:hypothetical protein